MGQDCFETDNEGVHVLDGTEIDGNIDSKKSIWLEGIVRGCVSTNSRLVVGKSAVVNGKVFCKELFLDGAITEDVHVNGKAILGPHAIIKGRLITACLQIVSGAVIENGLKLEKTANKK